MLPFCSADFDYFGIFNFDHMRTIRFRAWNIETERMVIDPYYFDIHHYSDENRVNKQVYRYYEDWRDLEDGRGYDCELMQFTGLHDKNGKEIFEGDLIKSINITMYGGIREIKWHNQICAWVGEWKLVKPILLYDFVNPEVIGNIYEHKHLLK